MRRLWDKRQGGNVPHPIVAYMLGRCARCDAPTAEYLGTDKRVEPDPLPPIPVCPVCAREYKAQPTRYAQRAWLTEALVICAERLDKWEGLYGNHGRHN